MKEGPVAIASLSKDEPMGSADASATHGSTDAAESTRVSVVANVADDSESPLAAQCPEAGHGNGDAIYLTDAR